VGRGGIAQDIADAKHDGDCTQAMSALNGYDERRANWTIITNRLGRTSRSGNVLSGSLVGCSDSAESADTPEGALAALARATNDQDDDAIKKLVCAEKWREQYTFRSTLAEMAKLDPRLADVKYRVRAGEVRDKTDTTATGVLEQLPAEGGPGPEDLSDKAEAALENMAAPMPIWLIREGDVINLVKENGTWVVC
jgi:hypothetical protein